MQLQQRALYNLMRLNFEKDSSLVVEPWQVVDYRTLAEDEIFREMKGLGVPMDAHRFKQFAQNCDTPEALSEVFTMDSMDARESDYLYLLVFELWRRYFPERQTLSIFCDELDQRIALFLSGKMASDEPIQDAIANLLDILEENVDAGAKPKAIFQEISSYLAHDLFSFLVDYISGLIDEKNETFAKELIEDYAPYIPEIIWFDFLRLRMLALTDTIEANQRLEKLLQHDDLLKIALLMEILRFQVGFGEKSLFATVVKKMTALLRTHEEFAEMLEIMIDYFHRRDREDWVEELQPLLKQHKKKTGAFVLSKEERQRLDLTQ